MNFPLKETVQRWRGRWTAKITIKICNPYPDNSKTTAYAVIFFSEYLIVAKNQTCRSSASPPPIREAASVLFGLRKNACHQNSIVYRLGTGTLPVTV